MPKLLKAVIVDDEPPARRILKQLLSVHENSISIIGEADNGAKSIEIINALRPDVIFLDIHLPDMLGFDVLKQLTCKPFVVFTTAYDDYAIKAFETLSVDYLLKPIKEERLALAIEKLQYLVTGQNTTTEWSKFENLVNTLHSGTTIKTLSIKKGNKFKLVQLSDILYLEAYDKYAFVYTQTGEKLFCDHMLATLEEKLSADFIRVQKSYIVNREKIAEIQKYSNNRFAIILNDKNLTQIVTGPSYHQTVKNLFGL